MRTYFPQLGDLLMNFFLRYLCPAPETTTTSFSARSSSEDRSSGEEDIAELAVTLETLEKFPAVSERVQDFLGAPAAATTATALASTSWSTLAPAEVSLHCQADHFSASSCSLRTTPFDRSVQPNCTLPCLLHRNSRLQNDMTLLSQIPQASDTFDGKRQSQATLSTFCCSDALLMRQLHGQLNCEKHAWVCCGASKEESTEPSSKPDNPMLITLPHIEAVPAVLAVDPTPEHRIHPSVYNSKQGPQHQCCRVDPGFHEHEIAWPRRLSDKEVEDRSASGAQAGTVPNLSPTQQIELLKNEFAHNVSILREIDLMMQEGYVAWRPIRGDGNCFFRAVGFGILEQLVCPSHEPLGRWASAFVRRLSSLSATYTHDQELQEHGELMHLISSLHLEQFQAFAGAWKSKALYDIMSTEFYACDAALVRALRRLTSDYVFTHPELDFEGLSLEMLCQIQFGSISNFCETILKPMGEEIQNPGLVAACNALDIDLRVVMMDRKLPKLSWEHFHPPVGSPNDNARPDIHLMLRFGHYDMLYANCFPA